MSQRPRCRPELGAAFTEKPPSRLRRKLDRQPGVAGTWSWKRGGETWTVEAGEERVRLQAPARVVATDDDVDCSCLLRHATSTSSPVSPPWSSLAPPARATKLLKKTQPRRTPA